MNSHFHAYWMRLSARERHVLAYLGLFLLVILVWCVLWRSQQTALREAEHRYEEQLIIHSDLHRLPRETLSQTRIDTEALPRFLARSSAQARLNVERMDNEDSGRVSLALSGALGDLLPWLEQVGQNGVEVTAMSLEVNPDTQAKARLTLGERG